MPPIPVLDAAGLVEGGERHADFSQALLVACRGNGCFYLKNHGLPDPLCAEVLRQAGRFFDLPPEAKDKIHIRRSTNFRGYSEMKNARDWREQMHFGQELDALPINAEHPDYERLTGQNQWPEALGFAFRSTMLNFLEEAGRLGQRLLKVLTNELRLPDDYFNRLSGQAPYNLMKLICYYPQPRDMERPGVAPHCDWSWLTILLQDDQGGLEIQTENGDWQAVTPRQDMLFVNLGELLEILTGGYFRATAHRVFNPSQQQRRLSVPVFINPALDALIQPGSENKTQPSSVAGATNPPKSHVHRVVARDAAKEAFFFGESEWRRKGLGYWCYNASCLQP